MHIICDKKTHEVACFGKVLTYTIYGYPLLKNENIAFIPEDVDTYEITQFPDEVVAGKYCYTPEKGFYENPNWVEPNPYGIPDELVAQIKNDAIAEVEEAVLNGTY